MRHYYRLLLDDYSAPSFTSLPKAYYGTLEQMAAFFEANTEDEQQAKNHANLLSAYEQYVTGDQKVCHLVAYQEELLLVPVEVLAEENAVLTEHSWEHLNTWGWPCDIKCDRAESSHIWVLCNGKYMRCIQVKFTNLRRKSLNGEYYSFGAATWGFPHQVEYDEPYTFSRLFVEEKAFADKAEALLDRQNFIAKPDPIFNGVLDDIFGDA